MRDEAAAAAESTRAEPPAGHLILASLKIPHRHLKLPLLFDISDSKRGLGQEQEHGQLCDDDPDTVFKQLQGVDSQKIQSTPRNFVLQQSSDLTAKDHVDRERKRKEDEMNQIMKKAALDREMEVQMEKVEAERRQKEKARQQQEEMRKEKEKEKEKERERLENLERVRAAALLDEERRKEEIARMKQKQAEDAANLRKTEMEKEVEEDKQRKLAQKREEEIKAYEIRVFQQKERKLMDLCEIVERKICVTRKRIALRTWIHRTMIRIADNEKKVM